MGKITYVKGDATSPIGEGKKIISHICNNENKWGAGFVLALSAKWKQPEANYRAMDEHVLGDVIIVPVEDNISVANMIAQDGVVSKNNPNYVPIRYDALLSALTMVNIEAKRTNASIHAPKFGAGLAGGNWKIIEAIIESVVTVPIIIYEFN